MTMRCTQFIGLNNYAMNYLNAHATLITSDNNIGTGMFEEVIKGRIWLEETNRNVIIQYEEVIQASP
jgi:hypothetical protein